MAIIRAGITKVQWDGLEELKIALRRLPQELQQEATTIVLSHAERAAQEIRDAYPIGTPGRKRKGVPIEPGGLVAGVQVFAAEAGPWGTKAVVRNRAKHATIYERGTKARHYFTVDGVKKLLGSMPAGNVFVPRMITWRHRMYDELKALLERQGLMVTGDA